MHRVIFNIVHTEWQIYFILWITAAYCQYVILPIPVLHSTKGECLGITLNACTNDTINVCGFLFFFFFISHLYVLSIFPFFHLFLSLVYFFSQSLQCLYLTCSHLPLNNQMEHFYKLCILNPSMIANVFIAYVFTFLIRYSTIITN